MSLLLSILLSLHYHLSIAYYLLMLNNNFTSPLSLWKPIHFLSIHYSHFLTNISITNFSRFKHSSLKIALTTHILFFPIASSMICKCNRIPKKIYTHIFLFLRYRHYLQFSPPPTFLTPSSPLSPHSLTRGGLLWRVLMTRMI